MDSFQKELTELLKNFREERNWEQYHTPKDIAMCLSVESNELLELFLWKNDQEIDRTKLQDEVADVLYALLLLCDKYEIDMKGAFYSKMKKNASKYPADRFYGSNRKYNE